MKNRREVRGSNKDHGGQVLYLAKHRIREKAKVKYEVKGKGKA